MSKVIRIAPNQIKTWKDKEDRHIICLDQGDITVVATLYNWQVEDLTKSLASDTKRGRLTEDGWCNLFEEVIKLEDQAKKSDSKRTVGEK